MNEQERIVSHGVAEAEGIAEQAPKQAEEMDVARKLRLLAHYMGMGNEGARKTAQEVEEHAANVDGLYQVIAALRRERDELRAALYEITRCDISDGGWGGPRALKIAREALAATNRAALSPSPVSTPTAEAEQTYVPPRGVTLPEGYEWAGEFRYPRKGEWFIDPDDHGPSEAQFDFRAGKHHIVRVKAEQAGGE